MDTQRPSYQQLRKRALNRMQLSTPEKILNAAEELFSQSGYDAVSIRQITQAADVRLALAHYHFGSKEALFNAVIQRRIGLLSKCRVELLQHYLELSDSEPIPLEQLVLAFVAPYLYWHQNGGPGWRSYSRLVAGLLGYNLPVLRDQFDPTARMFLVELRRSMPNASEAAVQWGFDFMVGLMCNTFAEVDRIKGLSDGLCTDEDKEDACQRLVTFIVAGLNGFIEKKQFKIQDTLSLLSEKILSKNLTTDPTEDL